jgi:hypothetical protein
MKKNQGQRARRQGEKVARREAAVAEKRKAAHMRANAHFGEIERGFITRAA